MYAGACIPRDMKKEWWWFTNKLYAYLRILILCLSCSAPVSFHLYLTCFLPGPLSSASYFFFFFIFFLLLLFPFTSQGLVFPLLFLLLSCFKTWFLCSFNSFSFFLSDLLSTISTSFLSSITWKILVYIECVITVYFIHWIFIIIKVDELALVFFSKNSFIFLWHALALFKNHRIVIPSRKVGSSSYTVKSLRRTFKPVAV